MTSPPVPPQAITAAIASLGHHHDVNLWLTAAEGTVGGLLARKQLLTRAVEAAAPHIAAAERERCAQLAEQHNAMCARIPEQPLQVTTTGTVQVWHDPPDVIPFAALLRKAPA